MMVSFVNGGRGGGEDVASIRHANGSSSSFDGESIVSGEGFFQRVGKVNRMRSVLTGEAEVVGAWGQFLPFFSRAGLWSE